MTWPIRSMNGVIPVVAGVEANTFPVRTSRAASRARAPWRWYSCSTRIGRPRAGGLVCQHRLRAWMEGLASTVIWGRQRASATAGDGPGLPVSPSVADGLSGEPPPRGQPTAELIPLWPLVDAAFALPVTDAYVRARPAATPSLIFVTPDNPGRTRGSAL